MKPLDRIAMDRIGAEMGPDMGPDRGPDIGTGIGQDSNPAQEKAVLADVVGMLEGSLAVLDRQGASLAAAHLSMVLDLMRKEIDGPVPPEGIAGIPATIQSTQLH